MSGATLMRGLTFLELIVVLLIVGVLLTLTLPSYRQSVLTAHRSEAVQALMALQLAQERFRSLQPRYARTVVELGQRDVSAQGRYRLSVPEASADGYVLEAQAQGDQAADRACQRLRLIQAQGQISHQSTAAADTTDTSTGVTPTSSATSGQPDRCWPQ